MEGLSKERRRSFRIEVGASACLWQRGAFRGGCQVSDLSLGGCQVRGGPTCSVGQNLELSLHLQDMQQDLRLPARVVRYSELGMGLRFTQKSPAAEDRIHDLLVRALEADPHSEHAVLVVHPHPEEIRPVVELLESQGHRVYMAATPLEAIWSLENSAQDIHTALVSRGLGPVDGLDVVCLLATRHPHIRRVLLSNERPDDANRPLGAAHLILRSPFDLSQLRRVIPGRKAQRLSA